MKTLVEVRPRGHARGFQWREIHVYDDGRSDKSGFVQWDREWSADVALADVNRFYSGRIGALIYTRAP